MQPSAWQDVQFAMATSARLNIPLLIAFFDSTPLGSPTKVWEAVSMTGKKPAGSTNQTMSFGGSAAGASQQAGSRNTATTTGTVSAGAPPEVLKALFAIQAELWQHPATKALTDAAVEQ